MRPMQIAALLFLLLASACASTEHQLANCTGPLEALNASHWQPTPAELDALNARLD